ncbi:MAG: DUF3467 domain-containing protein [Bacteroidetes bacterium]|jgi:polyphosphate kinase|nr:MAG: DUF3467 domain-containing protein [Bacteroidota bacterium]
MEDQAKTLPNNQLQIELSAEVARGVYSNLAVISHSDSEFVVDFIQIISGTPKAEVRSRVIMSPQNMKRLLLAMVENVEKYERQHGEIRINEKDVILPPNFGGPVGIA